MMLVIIFYNTFIELIMISKVRAKWSRLKAQGVWELRVFEDKKMGEAMTFFWIMMNR